MSSLGPRSRSTSITARCDSRPNLSARRLPLRRSLLSALPMPWAAGRGSGDGGQPGLTSGWVEVLASRHEIHGATKVGRDREAVQRPKTSGSQPPTTLGLLILCRSRCAGMTAWRSRGRSQEQGVRRQVCPAGTRPEKKVVIIDTQASVVACQDARPTIAACHRERTAGSRARTAGDWFYVLNATRIHCGERSARSPGRNSWTTYQACLRQHLALPSSSGCWPRRGASACRPPRDRTSTAHPPGRARAAPWLSG